VSNQATIVRYLGQQFSAATARAVIQASGLTIADVNAHAHAADPRALAALGETARHLGAGLAVIVNTHSPMSICIGGEIVEAWDLVAPTLREVIAARALTESAAATPVSPESLPTQARLRGATALVAAPAFAAPSIA
jgi:predicted NBD/HSP70 family sugar kinase